MIYMEKKTHRFLFTLPLSIYKKLRKAAFDRNISMGNYVLQALIWRLDQEIE